MNLAADDLLLYARIADAGSFSRMLEAALDEHPAARIVLKVHPPAPHPTLGVHENTVRYRLRKMAELSSVDLADGRKRVALMIELAALP